MVFVRPWERTSFKSTAGVLPTGSALSSYLWIAFTNGWSKFDLENTVFIRILKMYGLLFWVKWAKKRVWSSIEHKFPLQIVYLVAGRACCMSLKESCIMRVIKNRYLCKLWAWFQGRERSFVLFLHFPFFYGRIMSFVKPSQFFSYSRRTVLWQWNCLFKRCTF